MSHSKFLFVLIILSMLQGCASIISGTEQTIQVSSTPEGATVYVDGMPMGRTPTAVRLKKNKHSNIMVKMEGYSSQSLPMGKSFDGVALLNIFWDSSTTDAVTGAIFQYSPTAYHFDLRRKKRRSKNDE